MAVADQALRSVWPPGRTVGGRAQGDSVATGAADPEQYTAAKGHIQHLHRAGSVGGDGRHVRHLPRPRRSADDRHPGAPPDRGAGRPGVARLSTTAGRSSAETPSPSDPTATPTASSPRPSAPGSTCGGCRPTGRFSLDETTTTGSWRACCRRSASSSPRVDLDFDAVRAAARVAPPTGEFWFPDLPPLPLRDRMMRYLRRLADLDLALDRTMIRSAAAP